ncbi:S1 domain-containing RNA-binding protein [Saccharibacillus deserti]|uniref:S1 domain-containing RNA-binding protein n=1 Tax=Saccharibacillus deserti TaxID=1634444 RepID=UPI001553626A|nr:S1 domain-containing RNA-binding protein [Saccharibacillus deserti]
MAIEVGTKLEGKVTGITHFGAFVDLSGGVTGLVHISEIADNYVKDVNDHLKIGDMVTVKVINVDKDGKIGLSIKQTVDRPAGSAPAPSSRPPRQDRGPSSGGSGGGERFSGGGGGGGGFNRGGGSGGGRPSRPPGGGKPAFGKPAFGKPSFDDKLTRFLKDSEERISSIKKNTESKRGGRGAKRS